MRIYLIRHGRTAGNLLGKYIGRQTDESLCDEGIEELLSSKRISELISGLSNETMIFSGTMKRCVETARVLFPNCDLLLVENMTEIDFGDLENKNYLELADNTKYQDWLSLGGKGDFPSKESQKDFVERSFFCFKSVVFKMSNSGCEEAVLVCHGGNIMSIMSELTGQDYYDFQIKNGRAILLEFDIRGEDIDYISHNLI